MIRIIKCGDLLFLIKPIPQSPEEQSQPSPPSKPVDQQARRPWLPDAHQLDEFDHAFLDEFGALPEEEAALARLIVEQHRKEQEYLKKNQDKLQKLKSLYPGMSQEDLQELMLVFMNEPLVSLEEL